MRMAESLDKIAEKLKSGNRVGVDKNGTLMVSDPRNDGTSQRNLGNTTVESKRSYVF
jgi:hypothetical protein